MNITLGINPYIFSNGRKYKIEVVFVGWVTHVYGLVKQNVQYINQPGIHVWYVKNMKSVPSLPRGPLRPAFLPAKLVWSTRLFSFIF